MGAGEGEGGGEEARYEKPADIILASCEKFEEIKKYFFFNFLSLQVRVALAFVFEIV